MISKVNILSQRVNPHGGINFVVKELRKAGIPELIDKHLGKRVKQSKYSYSDAILSWCYANICGAEHLEDVMQIRKHLQDIPGQKCPSSDRLAGIFKDLAANNKKLHLSLSHPLHHFNVNKRMNDLLMRVMKHLRMIRNSSTTTLDYDNTIIETDKWDAKFTYEGSKGYCPGAGFIGDLPVYIEGRSGNCPASMKMMRTVRRCVEHLQDHGIKVKRFRSDAAAYQRSVVWYMHMNNIEFFIRAANSAALYDGYDVLNATHTRINNQRVRIVSYDYKPFELSVPFRVIVTENMETWLDQPHKYTGWNYMARAIITNNRTMTDKEVVEFYNQRGRMEKKFAHLKGEFNWDHLPFSTMPQNTAFMIIAAICEVLYQYVIKVISKKVEFVPRTIRLRGFIFRFIAIASFWRGNQLTLYEGGEKYLPLLL